MTLSQEQLNQLYESTVVSDDGQTLGRVGHIYLDDHTQRPAWVTFKTGLFGTKEIFAPLLGARFSENVIRVRFTKDYISDAPPIASDGHINDDEQAELYRYYRLDELRQQVTQEPVPAATQPPDLMVGGEGLPEGQDSPTEQVVPGQPEGAPPSQPETLPADQQPPSPERAAVSPGVPAPATQTGDIADVDADDPDAVAAAPEAESGDDVAAEAESSAAGRDDPDLER